MRDLKKTAYLLLVGLLTAGILYPLLHEAGHWAATLLLGGEILEFHLLPRPNVLCEVGKIGGAKRALIGLCGMVLPFAAALVLHPKRFTAWYVLLLLRGISAFALVLSLISVIGRDCGITILRAPREVRRAALPRDRRVPAVDEKADRRPVVSRVMRKFALVSGRKLLQGAA